MLKFLRLGAALAAVLSAQVISNPLATQANAASQRVEASTSTLVVTETLNTATDITTNANTSILTSDSSTNTPEMAEKVDGVKVILAMAVVSGGVVAVLLSAKNVNNSLKTSSRLSLKSKEDIVSIDQGSRKLQKQLLRLLHDDRDTATRLLSQVRMTNPDRSIDWCVEKVIYDLERDRGRY